MPNERDHVIPLGYEARLRVRFRKDGSHITEFVVQLEARLDDEWTPVVRYDTAHGRPHVDTIDRWGREVDKRWLEGSLNETLTQGIRDVRTN